MNYAVALVLAGALAQGGWKPPAPDSVGAPKNHESRDLACTPAELGRLRATYRRGDVIVRARVDRAKAALARKVEFPPRGGQHNQWYQCDKCQLGLVTESPTRHRCKRCGKVYTGAPYDDVIYSRIHSHNLTRARESAWAFALTGDEKLRADAVFILSGYADRYLRYPYHDSRRRTKHASDSGGHIKEQTLSEASMLIGQIGPAYALVRDGLTAAQRKHIDDGLIRPMVENIAKCRRGKSNWQSFHNAAMYWGGALLGEPEWMRRAVFDKKNGFLFQLAHCVSSDGMWYENSWGYHLYTLRALVSLAEVARRTGVDLWGHPALRKMCTLPAQYTMADGHLPRFGDDVNSSPSRAAGLLEAAWAATRAPEIERLLPNKDSWESIVHGRKLGVRSRPPVLSSKVFEGAGHAILRTNGPGRLTAALTFGPFGGFHGHFDKLSFVWYGFGSELGVDPGRARSQAYRLPIHKRWYRGTIAHNAVVVDGKPQQGANGELLAFVDGKGFAAVAARCTTAYPGVSHARCLVLTDAYLVVLDVLDAGAKPRRFDWVYHHRATDVVCAEADGEPANDIGMVGGEFIELSGSGSCDGAIRARFPAPSSTTWLTVAAGKGSQVHRGTGVGASVVDRVPLLIVRRSGKAARFAALLEPQSTASQPLRLHRVAIRDGARLEITGRGRTDRITWDEGRRIEVDLGR